MSDAEERERKKREIFNAMSPRRQQRILEKGYDAWDPFLAPKEPSRFLGHAEEGDRIRIREDPAALFDAFLGAYMRITSHREFLAGAKEICIGLCKGELRYQGMFAFCRWLAARRENKKEQ